METERFIMTAVSTERQSALNPRIRIAGVEEIMHIWGSAWKKKSGHKSMQDKRSGERYFEKAIRHKYHSLKQKILSLTR